MTSSGLNGRWLPLAVTLGVAVFTGGVSIATVALTTDATHDDQVDRLRAELVSNDKQELREVLDEAAGDLTEAINQVGRLTALWRSPRYYGTAEFRTEQRRLTRLMVATNVSAQRLAIRLGLGIPAAQHYSLAFGTIVEVQKRVAFALPS